MPKPIDILDECAAEIAAAFKGYQAISEGLGLNFLTAIETSLNNLIANPKLGPIAHRNARKIVLTRFPYIIYYLDTVDNIQLILFEHAKRNPASIKRILQDREKPDRVHPHNIGNRKPSRHR